MARFYLYHLMLLPKNFTHLDHKKQDRIKVGLNSVSNTLLCSLGPYPLPRVFYFLPDFGSCEKLMWALAFPAKEMGQVSALGVAETSSREKF